MQARLRHFLSVCAIAAAAGVILLPPARALEPIELRWQQLIPPSLRQVAAGSLAAKFLSHKGAIDHGNMSMSPQADLVGDYNGRRVKISGFVVPFDGDEQPLKRFLLIPFAGACVKFPPPRNQAVLVVIERGIQLTDYYDPVAVTGVFGVAPTQTKIAKIGYRLSADVIEPQE
jgi:uncharacterized protein